MPIEIRLKALLQQHKLDTPGVLKRMSEDLDLHRHTVGKLYRNEATNPSLETLDRICDWLMEHHVPARDLPRQLFGFRAMKLWDSLAGSKQVTFYLGEYIQETGLPGHLQRWISRWDADAVNGIIKHLTIMEPSRGSHPQLRTEYAAFRAGVNRNGKPRAAELEQDKKASMLLFEEMRNKSDHETPVIIGSQRVNYLLEHFVADLFGCEPFQPGPLSRIPFYLRYRTSDRAVPSCFGGREGPPRQEPPGVYYLSGANNKWVQCAWEPRTQDAGIVIVVREPGNEALEIALFGFSGWSTVVIGRQLDQNAKSFWPPVAQWRGKEVGVYVCRMTFRPLGDPTVNLAVPEAESFEVIPIDQTVLEERLR